MPSNTHADGWFDLTAQQPKEQHRSSPPSGARPPVLGGVQSPALSCYDEALFPSRPRKRSASQYTQQIIGRGDRVTNTVDPLGGSYYVEWLTDELEPRLASPRRDR